MEIYTYKDYLQYQYKNLKVKEEETKYQTKLPRNQKHDKIFKEILDNKKEGVKLLNKYLDLKIKEHEIEKYTRKFVLPELENRESDVIYKMKEKPIFFLIEHQTKVDYSMPFRMLEYSMEIIKSAITKEKMKSKNTIYPIVMPIVLYTGKERWKVPRTFEERQYSYNSENRNLQFKYNLIDGNQMAKEKLIKEDSILSKAILLEKLEKPEEILETLREITEKNLDADEKYFINLILKYLLPDKLRENEKAEIIENLKEKEDDNMFIDILKKYFEDKEETAVKTAVKTAVEKNTEVTTHKLIREMLKKNIDEETVKEITKISNQELKEIKAAMC